MVPVKQNVVTSSVNFRRKSEVAYTWLRDAIIDGTLPGGERLVIDDLAVQLGISPIPIREALSQLQAEGFVIFKPHVGATVTELYPELAYEIFGLLEAVEVICGRNVCLQRNKEFLDHLETLLHELDGMVDDPELFSKANADFHQQICHQAGAVLMGNIVNHVWLHWDRLRRAYLAEVFARQTRIAQQEHWELLEALRAGDPDRVEEVSRRHNRRAQEAYRSYIATNPDAVPTPSSTLNT
jgi:DNA-binding GntR family transcriptional regulator